MHILNTGLPKFWETSSKFSKVQGFGSILNINLRLRYKTVLSSITKFKRYCKGALNVFFYLIKWMITKNFYLYDKFFVSNRDFITSHVIIV